MKKYQGIKLKNQKKDPDKTVSYSDIEMKTFNADGKLLKTKIIKSKVLKNKEIGKGK